MPLLKLQNEQHYTTAQKTWSLSEELHDLICKSLSGSGTSTGLPECRKGCNQKEVKNDTIYFHRYLVIQKFLQCFDAVGWATGRASSL